MGFDPRAAFVGEVARLDSPLGPLELGVVDADAPGVAEGVSRLLVRSIQDARAEVGGHLPTWLVRDIERNYISPEKVRTLWAPTGHRFALVLGSEIVGTVHVAKSERTILTVDRHVINVDEDAHPGFKPPRHHHVVNLSVLHELRRARLGLLMIEAIAGRFRHLFTGEGLWVRADPPWHAGLVGLGFAHDPRLDVFLPPSAERTAGLPHDELNRRYACDCGPKRPELATHKLQYVSMTRPFARATVGSAARGAPALDAPTEAHARDFGGTIELVPRAVARPASIDELSVVLAWATRERRRVTVRGRGQSHAGQALGDDVALSTERLDRILGASGDVVTVEGGATWRALAASGTRCPMVTPTIADASVGGTLSSIGLGFGSVRHGLAIDHVTSLLVVTGDGRQIACDRTQARWLFEAALGGYGQFGVVARASLRLAEPIAFGRADAVRGDLADALVAFEADGTLDAAARVTATEVVARREIAGARSLASHIESRRAAEPRGPSVLCQVFVARAGLAPLLAFVRRRVDLSRDDEALWIHPFLDRADRPSLFVPRVAPDALAFAVTLSSGAADRAVDALRARNDEIVAEARRLGGAPTLQGGACDLGDRAARARVAKRLADPASVLSSPRVAWDA